MIYGVDESKLSPLSLCVWRIVYPLHVGKNNAILGRDLFRMVRYDFSKEKAIDRKVRETFEVGGELCGHVVTVGFGYYVPRDDKEAAEAMTHLTKYIKAIAGRRKAISDTYPDAAQGDLWGAA